MMSCMYSYKLKIEESVKNDVEIDTIDNDDEKRVYWSFWKYDTVSNYPLQVLQN